MVSNKNFPDIRSNLNRNQRIHTHDVKTFSATYLVLVLFYRYVLYFLNLQTNLIDNTAVIMKKMKFFLYKNM